MFKSLAAFGVVAASLATYPARAQVVYSPYEAPYGIPVPGGVLQPDEVAGTSPSYVIAPGFYGYGPAVGVVARCQYPDGWNVTDFTRDLNGTPAGIDHTCRAPYRHLRARY